MYPTDSDKIALASTVKSRSRKVSQFNDEHYSGMHNNSRDLNKAQEKDFSVMDSARQINYTSKIVDLE